MDYETGSSVAAQLSSNCRVSREDGVKTVGTSDQSSAQSVYDPVSKDCARQQMECYGEF